MFQWQD